MAYVVGMTGGIGSGKTEVYLRAIAEALSRGRGAFLLVPEIALEPQVAQRLLAHFPERVALLHSGLSEGEWTRMWTSRAPFLRRSTTSSAS